MRDIRPHPKLAEQVLTSPTGRGGVPFARFLRNNAAADERVLWSRLRNRGLNGYKFYRQKPFGKFVVDFYCHEAKLVVELDGSQHNDPAAMNTDGARTQYLNSLGMTVLRFHNHEIHNNLGGVLDAILANIETQTATPPLPVGEVKIAEAILGEGSGQK